MKKYKLSKISQEMMDDFIEDLDLFHEIYRERYISTLRKVFIAKDFENDCIHVVGPKDAIDRLSPFGITGYSHDAFFYFFRSDFHTDDSGFETSRFFKEMSRDAMVLPNFYTFDELLEKQEIILSEERQWIGGG